MLGFLPHPENVEDAVLVSQFAQAWGYKRLVEHCRQRSEECGGIVLWKLNDCWPAVDAGLLDWEGTPRLAYDFVKESNKPVAVSVESSVNDDYSQSRIWVHNDSASAVTDTVSWEKSLKGTIVESGTFTVEVPAGKSVADRQPHSTK